MSVSYTPLLACGLWLRMKIEERQSYEPARSGKACCSWALGAAYARACCGWRTNAKPRPSRLPRWDTRLHLRHHHRHQQREAQRGTARHGKVHTRDYSSSWPEVRRGTTRPSSKSPRLHLAAQMNASCTEIRALGCCFCRSRSRPPRRSASGAVVGLAAALISRLEAWRGRATVRWLSRGHRCRIELRGRRRKATPSGARDSGATMATQPAFK